MLGNASANRFFMERKARNEDYRSAGGWLLLRFRAVQPRQLDGRGHGEDQTKEQDRCPTDCAGQSEVNPRFDFRRPCRTVRLDVTTSISHASHYTYDPEKGQTAEDDTDADTKPEPVLFPHTLFSLQPAC